MSMYVTRGVILLAVLGGGCATSRPLIQVGPCNDPMKPAIAHVQIQLSPDPHVDQCRRGDPVPNPVIVCPYTETIQWTFDNTKGCKEVSASIGLRKSIHAGVLDDPLAATAAILDSDPTPVPIPSAGTAGTAVVKAAVNIGAKDDCYKYNIVIDGVDTDPEIEVRRGNGVLDPCPSVLPVPMHRLRP
jgi:hypothetical protein